jgi:hypothetical protein
VIQHWQEHPVNRENADGTAREDALTVERVVARGALTWLGLARWGREKAEPARLAGHRGLGHCPGHQQPEAAVREAGGGGRAGARGGEEEGIQAGRDSVRLRFAISRTEEMLERIVSDLIGVAKLEGPRRPFVQLVRLLWAEGSLSALIDVSGEGGIGVIAQAKHRDAAQDESHGRFVVLHLRGRFDHGSISFGDYRERDDHRLGRLMGIISLG